MFRQYFSKGFSFCPVAISHWTYQDMVTCPVLDMCPQSNVSGQKPDPLVRVIVAFLLDCHLFLFLLK